MEEQDLKSKPQRNPSHWQKLSPRRLEHRVYLPTAISFHRLAPESFRTLRNHHKVVPHPYKHLDPEEIARAQAKARHALLKAKFTKDGALDPVKSALHDYDKDQCQEYQGSSETDGKGVKNSLPPKGSVKIQDKIDNAQTSKDNQNTKSVQKSQGQIKSTKRDQESQGQVKTTKNDPKSQRQISTRPKLPIYRGIGENNLRIRQITRHAAMIMDCLKDLDSAPKAPDVKKEFVSPSEMEVRKKRWNEFLHSSRRILFTLRREVNLIEKTLKSEQRSDKFFRMLASSTVALHKLLLAVKTHLETALKSPHGKKLYNDLIVVCHRMLKIISFLGIQPPKLKWKVPANVAEKETEEGSSDSDVSASVLQVLQPEYVRNRLIQIANEKLPMKEGNKVTFSEDQVGSEMVGEDQRTCSTNGGPVSSKTNKKPTIPCHTCSEDSCSQTDRQTNRCHPSKTLSPSWRVEGDKYQSVESKEDTPQEPVPPPYPYPAVVCKMQDEDHWVEKTASEVISRLIPLIDHHSPKEKHKDQPDSEMQSSSQSKEDSLFIKDIDHQIEFMLERLCRIEEEQKQSINIITEISLRTNKKALCRDDSLQAAINQAQNVLGNLIQTKTSTARLDTCDVLPLAPKNLCNYGENKFMDINVPYDETSAKGRTTSDGRMSMEGDSTNIVFANGSFPVQYHENINDQINRQKEEFWASLVEQGVMKPFGISVGATKNTSETIDLQQAVHDFVTKGRPSEKRSDSVGEGITIKTSPLSTNAKREITLGKTNKQDKATLVTSLLSSYSDSFETESTEQSRSSKVREESKSEERIEDNRSSGQSTVKSSDFLSSHTGMNDTEPSSFPSYGNVSISEDKQLEL